MAEYAYDEEGYNFLYFVISVLSICLVPVTLQSIYSGWKSAKEDKEENFCQCDTCQIERKKLRKAQSNRVVSQLFKPKFLFLIAGWVAVALLAYQVSFAEAPKQHWDPYEILGISEGATVPEIKKVYKKLSLVYHPDKAQPGTERESEERFIQISKAYQVLTDDDVRENYEKYGHPDGKQSYSVGVALPKKLVEGGNSKFVLAIYACIFGLGLPYYIARWWYNSRRHTKDRILNGSMRVFVKELKENADFKALIRILSGAHEFLENAAPRPGDEKVIKAVNSAIAEELENRFGEKYDNGNESVPAYRRKASSLLYAYFLRQDLNSKGSGAEAKALLQDQRFIVEKSVHLLQGLLQIAIVKQWLGVASNVMDLQQHLLQATYPGEQSVKQLPHINTQILRRYYRNKKKHIHSVQQTLALSESERKELLKPLDDQQYLDVTEVATRIPQLKVNKAVFKVVGDKIITPGAIVTFVLKLQNTNEAAVEDSKKPAAAAASDDSDDEELLDDVTGKAKEEDKPNGTLPCAHTPYYPGEKKPYWWVFLGDPKVNRILVPPKKVTDVTEEQTVQISFPGPPKPGTYTFSLFVKSDTYVGTDIQQDIKLTIRDKADLPPEDDVDDSISEPEEDSIAGQMKMMREQGISGALQGGQKDPQAKADEDSDSDSSDDE
ncbi:Sec63 Brl domain-containing protein [Zychaea mexicana]|uniref:Sec63 Brl domain-containing protein n=1 Tax=Zychaea mexicana TaxID=64656 RepID=UPI0022FE779B|nr:Sec63 Brl domain-containing protein [Zychaea mexicana]KAI9496946.1 Sec63 Brl domain-containing protein [Zychaea mexicana]